MAKTLQEMSDDELKLMLDSVDSKGSTRLSDLTTEQLVNMIPDNARPVATNTKRSTDMDQIVSGTTRGTVEALLPAAIGLANPAAGAVALMGYPFLDYVASLVTGKSPLRQGIDKVFGEIGERSPSFKQSFPEIDTPEGRTALLTSNLLSTAGGLAKFASLFRKNPQLEKFADYLSINPKAEVAASVPTGLIMADQLEKDDPAGALVTGLLSTVATSGRSPFKGTTQLEQADKIASQTYKEINNLGVKTTLAFNKHFANELEKIANKYQLSATPKNQKPLLDQIRKIRNDKKPISWEGFRKIRADITQDMKKGKVNQGASSEMINSWDEIIRSGRNSLNFAPPKKGGKKLQYKYSTQEGKDIIKEEGINDLINLESTARSNYAKARRTEEEVRRRQTQPKLNRIRDEIEAGVSNLSSSEQARALDYVAPSVAEKTTGAIGRMLDPRGLSGLGAAGLTGYNLGLPSAIGLTLAGLGSQALSNRLRDSRLARARADVNPTVPKLLDLQFPINLKTVGGKALNVTPEALRELDFSEYGLL